MKTITILLLIFSINTALAYPAGPLPPAPDVMTGTPAEREAHFNLVCDYIKDWIRFDILKAYTRLQNEDTTNLELVYKQIESLMIHINHYRDASPCFFE